MRAFVWFCHGATWTVSSRPNSLPPSRLSDRCAKGKVRRGPCDDARVLDRVPVGHRRHSARRPQQRGAQRGGGRRLACHRPCFNLAGGGWAQRGVSGVLRILIPDSRRHMHDRRHRRRHHGDLLRREVQKPPRDRPRRRAADRLARLRAELRSRHRGRHSAVLRPADAAHGVHHRRHRLRDLRLRARLHGGFPGA